MTKESLDGHRGFMTGTLVGGPLEPIADLWAAHQAYVALGAFLTSAALLGADARDEVTGSARMLSEAGANIDPFVAGMLPLAVSCSVCSGTNRTVASVIIAVQALALVLTLVRTPMAYRISGDWSTRCLLASLVAWVLGGRTA